MTTDRDYSLVPAGDDLDPPLLAEAKRYALALSRADMLPEGLRGHPGNTLMVLLLGHELGLSWVTAMQFIAVINRRPAITGRLWAMLLGRAGVQRETTATNEQATVKLTRRDTGETYTAIWTLEDAAAAELCKLVDGRPVARSKDGRKLPWELYTRRMLVWRATSEAASILCPELALGMDIADEDMTADAAVVVAAERADRPTETGDMPYEEIERLIAGHDTTPQQAREPDDEVPAPAPHQPPSLKAMKALHARIAELGWADTDRHAVLSHGLERPVRSARELTADDVSELLTWLGILPAPTLAEWPLDRQFIVDHGRELLAAGS